MYRRFRLQSSLLFAVLLLLPLLAVACGGSEAKAVEVGADAPDFRLSTHDGREVTLADLRGRPTLLFFHMAMG